MNQFYQFVLWMCRRAVMVPGRLIKTCVKGLDYIAETTYEEGGLGIVLAVLVSVAIGLLGFIAGGIYEESIKEPDTIVSIDSVIGYAGMTWAVSAAVIFFHTCWYCFKQEQNELVNKLKDTHRE